jgi:hypothetical protein
MLRVKRRVDFAILAANRRICERAERLSARCLDDAARSAGQPLTAPSTLSEAEDLVTAVALSSLAGRRRAFARGAAGVPSAGVRVSREAAAHPGGFGKSDRLSADLGEVRDTNHELDERRVRAGSSPLRR